MGTSRWSLSEVDGFSSGIKLLRNKEEIKLKLLYIHKFFMHAEVTSPEGFFYEVSAVHANLCANSHKFFWNIMDEKRIENPYLVTRDFYCVLRGE